MEFKRIKMEKYNRSNSSFLPILQNRGPFTIDGYSDINAIKDLNTKKVLILGAGGLGCEIIKNLALSGFKNIHVIDMDTIDVSNLNRQFLFRPSDIGQLKAIVAANFIRKRMQDERLKIVSHFNKIQDLSVSFYQQFDLIISGLDNVEARRWINNLIVKSYDISDDDSLIPMIDGGTEGFRGQSRIIFPRITACYECTLNLMGDDTHKKYPICTIANTPRLPEHCIEYVNLIEWPNSSPFKDVQFDSDIPDHVDWVYNQALKRATEFHIEGVTRLLTLGVVKNIIPSIASTNAIIAASCCNEAFKLITNCNPTLEYTMQYAGDQEPYSLVFESGRDPNCPVCGDNA